MAQLVFPPQALPQNSHLPKVFLAGSIDMGLAPNWQTELSTALEAWPGWILNPRRPDWDPTWDQSPHNPQFVEQVNWELLGLEMADLICMYLAPESKAPISLLELGLHAQSGRLVICCPEGFWRRGNVLVVAQRYGISQVEKLSDFIPLIKSLHRS